MQKSKLGVSVGLIGAAAFLLCLFGGYIPALLLLGYVLIAEENMWLRKTVVKAVVLMLLFSVVVGVINFVPSLLSVVNDLFGMFEESFYLPFVSNGISAILTLVTMLEKVVFLVFAVMALLQRTITIPGLDAFIDKCMD